MTDIILYVSMGVRTGSRSSIRLGSGSRCELETWDWKQVRVLDLGLAAGASMILGTGSRREHETWDWQQVRVLDWGLAAGASIRLTRHLTPSHSPPDPFSLAT